ncbi:MAG TPA: inositol monophosphatase family protein [Acidimicrobiales bacterium]|nr:inositol monophosphatase family protein [Acidimicrobiales bacterium]
MPHSDLAFALSLADAADEISMKWFRSTDLPVEAKSDDTPVSIADREVEEKLRSMIAKDHSDSGVIGEEFGVHEASDGTSTRFVIDPIDGTKNYVRGVPVWATLIALEVEGVCELGVVSAPALGYRWWGVLGAGAWRNGEEIHVSSTATIEEAFLSSDSYTTFKQWDPPRSDAWDALVARCARTRGYGDFWSHMLVAEGAIDIAVEPSVTLWDLAASSVIVEAAGGRFTSLDGVPGPDGGNVVATNGLLHDAVLGALNANA